MTQCRGLPKRWNLAGMAPQAPESAGAMADQSKFHWQIP